MVRKNLTRLAEILLLLVGFIFLIDLKAEIFNNKKLSQKNISSFQKSAPSLQGTEKFKKLPSKTSPSKISPRIPKSPLTKSSTSFKDINLCVAGYKIPRSFNLQIIINSSRKLRPEEERRAFVLITLPNGSKKSYYLGDRRIEKRSHRYGVNYMIPLFNITSGGDFKVEVDPANFFSEWDESDNIKIFHISTKDIERRWEADIDLLAATIYVKKLTTHTVVFEVESRGRLLSSEEERKCKVMIAYPQNQFVTDLSHFTKTKGRDKVYYRLELRNIYKGGDFMMKVDADNAIFEKNEKNNTKKVTLAKEDLSPLTVTFPTSPLTIISGSKVRVEWEYRRPQGYVGNDFYIEVVDLFGKRVNGINAVYNPQNYSYQVVMPYNLGVYRIKVTAPDTRNSYGMSAPIKVIAASFTNPTSFKITSQPKKISNGSTITISWQADPEVYSHLEKIEVVRPNLTTRLFYINLPIDIRRLVSSGSFSFEINLDPQAFENDRADIFLKFKLHRKGIDQIDQYISDLIEVRK